MIDRLTRGAVGFALLVTAARPTVLWAQADTTRAAPPRDSLHSHALDTVKVTGRSDNLIGVAATASEGRVGQVDLERRPLTREGELLETVPGLIVTQHSGDGKANQYFVRGFNLDHGTDFQTSIEGMPVNMPSHAHGQGYTDLNFLIPELVDYLDYRLGVYHASVGDFGSAGAAEFHLARKLDQPFATVSGGENGLARIAAGGSRHVGDGDLLVGGEVKTYNGPWDLGENVRKFSGLARYSWDRGQSRFSVLGMAYHNTWDSSDQIPLRAVNDGLIDRFGQIDSTDGGGTERYSLSGTWHHTGASSAQDVELFGIYSDLSLFSDFTYFLDHPDDGDQFNQREHRVVLGGHASHKQEVHALGIDHLVTVGLQNRVDIVNGLGLYHTVRDVPVGTVRRDNVLESGSGLYVEAESPWRPWLRTVLGARGDVYTFDVRSDDPLNSGHRNAGIVSPKASLIFTLSPRAELYASAGLGFHSNDARGTTITVDPSTGDPVHRVDPLVRSHGAEVGARLTLVHDWRSTLSVWFLNLDSELLFTGDGGTTEPSNRSVRRGVTWANFYRPIPQLSLDADISLARARFTDVAPDQTFVPGALENVVAGGITWRSPTKGLFGAMRVRHFGSYPLIEDNSVRATATTLLNADAGYAFSGIRVQVSVLNLTNQRADDIQYYYASRLPGEPAGGVNDIHFHPVEPRQLRASLGWDFGTRR